MSYIILFEGNSVFIFAAPEFGVSQIEALYITLISCGVVMSMDRTLLT